MASRYDYHADQVGPRHAADVILLPLLGPLVLLYLAPGWIWAAWQRRQRAKVKSRCRTPKPRQKRLTAPPRAKKRKPRKAKQRQLALPPPR